MSEIIRIPVGENAYWKLKELKAKMKCKNWTEFFEELCRIIEDQKVIEAYVKKKRESRYTNFLM